jgi:SAM-dependent methyltransferase
MLEKTCQICDNKIDNQAFSFQDYHLGLPDTFAYFQCSECGCLQKEQLQDDNSQFYPNDYYSFSHDDRTTFSSKAKWMIRDIRNTYYRTGKGWLGSLINLILPCKSVETLTKANPQLNWNILDAGCGSDALVLQYLASQGYKNLTGIDPYLQSEMIERGPIKIYKKELHELSDRFDLISFNHSFEHISDQKNTLLHSRKLLKDSGIIIMRIPTVDSYAWEHDKGLWPNLDAPRHLFLHSIKSITKLADQCGLKIESKYHDQTAFPFWGKKLYENNIPLHSKKMSHRIIQLTLRVFYSLAYYKKVKQINATSQGDLVALVMKKK